VKKLAIPIFAESRNNRRAASSHGRNSRKINMGNIMMLIVFVMRRTDMKAFSGRSNRPQRTNTIMQSRMIHKSDTKLTQANAQALHFKKVGDVSMINDRMIGLYT
jgi:hypothetical protein